MNDQDVFQCRRLPARLTINQVALVLGFHPDGIDLLVDFGLIDALGGAPRGVQRMFAAVYIEQLAHDVKWLHKATGKIRQSHRERNQARKKTNEPIGEPASA